MLIFLSLPFLKYFFLLSRQPLKSKAVRMSVLKASFKAKRLAALPLGIWSPRGEKKKACEETAGWLPPGLVKVGELSGRVCWGEEMDVCNGRSAQPAERCYLVAGSERKLVGLLKNEVIREDRLEGKKNKSLRICLRLNPASTGKGMIQADITSVFFQ